MSRNDTLMLANILTKQTRLVQLFGRILDFSETVNATVHSLDDAGVLNVATQANNG